MGRVIYLVQFFRAVPPTPPLMGPAFAITVVVASAIVIADPMRVRQALMPLLMLQLFACSSGFMIPARRGHYDLVLTSGDTRLTIASVHWMMSMLPGIAAWLVVSLVEAIVLGGASVSALAPGSVVAWALVSTLPWALTVTLPRFAGAIGWLLALAVTATAAPGALNVDLFSSIADGSSWFEAALGLLLYPPAMVGEDFAGPQVWLAAPPLLVAAFAMVYAFGWIDHEDIPLEASQ